MRRLLPPTPGRRDVDAPEGEGPFGRADAFIILYSVAAKRASRHCRSIFSFSFLQHTAYRRSGLPRSRSPSSSSLATLLCVLGVCVRSAPARPDERRRPCVTRSAERSVHVAAGHEPVNVHRGTNSTFGSLRSCAREQLPCEARRSLPAHCAACARVRGALHSTAGLTFLQTGRAWLAASRSSSPLA